MIAGGVGGVGAVVESDNVPCEAMLGVAGILLDVLFADREFFERYVGALPTNTGAPGTVENTVSESVVWPPVAPRNGSSSA